MQLPRSALEAWNVKARKFPSGGSIQDKLLFALRYAILAPSGHNTQPWLFRIEGQAIEVFADRTRALAVVDPFDRELTMSCGTALFHLQLALRCFGFDSTAKVLPRPDEPDLLARVEVSGACSPSDDDAGMIEAIPARRTNRNPFQNHPLPEGLPLQLEHAAAAEGAALFMAEEARDKARIAELIARGDRTQMSDPSFRRELAAWVHYNRSRVLDGMRGYSFGIGNLMSLGGAFVIRTFDLGKGQAAKDLELANGSPALAVLHTSADQPADWICAGRALAHVLLRATVAGVSTSYLNQPIELAELRPRLAELTCGGERYPQILLRLGVCEVEPPPVPRRPVEDVLL